MPSKNVKTKKESGIARWWRETTGELRKVTWPTRKEAWQTTKVVLLVMLLVGSLLALLDSVFTRLVALILS
ncbi:MAG: Preprotein translocase SecE subunit [Anaerolinea thermophila]|uniref:Protein translocase subunit SecE n=1 Tax=Anaerolinea thermophila TaxID=167964 RepID=A0A101FX46_9CHLR|nr:MAG: Preprotein translocase SecE subunit [Anaerolinea thermophila]